MPRRPRILPHKDRSRPATWDDLDQVPEGYIGEIVGGEIVVAPRPNEPHAHATSDLGVLLGGPFRLGIGGPGGWVFRDEPRIRFGEDIRVPDLAGWQAARWGTPPRKGPLTVTPDWICEVLSPSTAADDRTVKLPLYARAAVRHVWLIDPDARTLEVLRLEGSSWLLAATFGGDARVRAEPFDAVELDLSLCGSRPLPTPTPTKFDAVRHVAIGCAHGRMEEAAGGGGDPPRGDERTRRRQIVAARHTKKSGPLSGPAR